MTARARHPYETMEDYKRNLKVEDMAISHRLRGKPFHISQRVVQGLVSKQPIVIGKTYIRPEPKPRYRGGWHRGKVTKRERKYMKWLEEI